jgi:ADP-heptose:LPS heptosyltransferase
MFNKKQNKIKTIAIIFGAKIGDVVNVQPVCRTLKQKYPDAKLVFITWPSAVEIAKLLPEVDFIETFDNKGRGKNPIVFLKDALKIRFKHKIDLSVMINDSFTYTVMGFLIGSKYRVGRHKHGRDFLLHKKYSLSTHDLEEIHIIESYLKAVAPLGLSTNDYSLELRTDFSEADEEYVNNLLKHAGDKKLIGFSPCSALEHKDWTIEEAKKFIDGINAKENYKIVLTGDYVAKGFADKLKELGCSDFIDASCQTNLNQFLVLLKRFHKFVTVDTGSAHLAYVMKTPTLVMFFVDHRKVWGPLDTNLHKMIYKPDKFSLPAEEALAELEL